MTNKRRNFQLDESNVIDILGATNFESEDTHPSDPITKSRIRVTIDQLQPYSHNPRTTRNPKFDEIMASIESVGLDNPPNITRRTPDDPHYTILDGGNTRLEILTILHQKYRDLAESASTDDERLAHLNKAESFYCIDCVFKPWESESRALAGHMSENENRGDMLFIEKALAVQKLRRFYLEEDARQSGKSPEDIEPMSMRKLAERITAQGWSVSASHLSRYDYAAGTLIKALPNCFWAGAGHSLVRQLRRIDNAYTQFWSNTDQGREQPSRVGDLFIDTLKLYDDSTSVTPDIEAFQRELNERLAGELDRSPIEVMIEVRSILNGSNGLPVEPHSPFPALPDLMPDAQGSPLSMESPAVGLGRTGVLEGPTANADTPPSPGPRSSDGSTSATRRRQSAEKPGESRAPSSDRILRPALNNTSLFEAALRIAERYDILIGPKDMMPFGIVLPNEGFEQIFAQMSPAERATEEARYRQAFVFVPGKDDHRAAVWWFLTRISHSYNDTDHFINMLYRMFYLYFGDDLRDVQQRVPVYAILMKLEYQITHLPHDVHEQLCQLSLGCAAVFQKKNSRNHTE